MIGHSINVPIENHPLIGTQHTFRPDLEPVKPEDHQSGGTLVVAPGMHVTVRAVFTNWNAVPGLDMLYVTVHETGLNTHVTPDSLGLNGLISTSSKRGA